jgi:peptidyl-dipeptidase Dcp
MLKVLATALTSLLLLQAIAQQNNPLLQRSTLQYQAPHFDKIKDEHFKPAFDIALKEHDAEIEKIINNPEKPTFANTVLALETSGENLNRATTIFFNLTGSNTNATVQKIEEEYAAVFSAHNDGIYLNSKLYNRLKAINAATLKGEDKTLLQYYLLQFNLSGANLAESKKVKLKTINEEIATLSTNFSNKLLVARKNAAVLIDTEAELAGLTIQEIASAKKKAEDAGHTGKYLLTVTNTTQQPALQNLTNRATREKLFTSAWNRAEKNDEADTRAIIEKLALLRLQKANLLGKKSFADWRLQDQMAKVPANAMRLLQTIGEKAAAKASEEAKAIQAIIKKEGNDFKLQPWDWNYYAEKVRKEKYDLDANEVKPYFEVKKTLEDGVFYAAKIFYGITFKSRTDLPVYQEDVMVYEVFDKDGTSIAIYYLDFYTRDNKSGGAWMNNFVPQSHYLKQKPVIVNVFNFQKPTEGNPSLISFDNVITMFHEFGHSIHGIFANQQYATLSGTNVPRDFVEFPSQINEHCALAPNILKNYAVHYQTNQPIPQALINKIKKAETFNKGYTVTENIAAATLDMAWHSITDATQIKPTIQFEKEALQKAKLWVEEVPTRYRSSYFSHIWGGGYSAGYYAYTWSKTLDYNAFDWLMANGGITRANGDKIRKHILSVGNSMDLNKAFINLTGKPMAVEPYLKNAGLIK